MQTKLVPEATAKEIMSPYLVKIQGIYNDALENLNNMVSVSKTVLKPSVKAGIVHNTAIDLAQTCFSGDPNVSLYPKYGSLLIVFRSGDISLIGRFKKLNKNDLSAKNSTKRSNQITSQQSLFGDNYTYTYVDMGYRMDATNTAYEAIKIVCRLDDSVVWLFELNDDIQSLPVTITTNPVAPTPNEEKQIKVKKKNG